MEKTEYNRSKIMNGVLDEEYERLVKLEKFYTEEIQKLPKGSIMERKINGKSYFYLKFRDQTGKVISKYIKKADLFGISSQINERKRMYNLLKQIIVDRKVLAKALHIK